MVVALLIAVLAAAGAANVAAHRHATHGGVEGWPRGRAPPASHVAARALRGGATRPLVL